MSKIARQKSISGYYHIIIRGNGKQVLFERREDYVFFLHLLKKYSQSMSVSINAYCLMENHVHLLIYDPMDQKADMMHGIELCYAGYFNDKYDHTGHLFQGRYLSEAINSERYLLTAFHYILNNPPKAGICRAEEYEWSSYALYASTSSFVDTSFFVSRIGDWNRYRNFVNSCIDEDCLEYENKRLTDARAVEIIQTKLGISNGRILQTFGKKERNAAIVLLKKEGLSCRQIERLTGIARGIIQHV